MGSRRTHDDRLDAAPRGRADRRGAGPAVQPDRARPRRPHPGGDRGQHRRRDHRRPVGRLRRAAGRHRRPDPPRDGPRSRLTAWRAAAGVRRASGRSPCSRCSPRCTGAGARPPTTTRARSTPRRRRRRPEPQPDRRAPPTTPTEEPEPEPTTLPPVHHRGLAARADARGALGPTRIAPPARLLGTADAYTRYEVTYRSGDLTRLRRAAGPDRQGPVPRRSCSTTATSSRRSTSPARGWPASRTGSPAPASSCCTPTTAATPAPTRDADLEPRDPARLHRGHDQRRPRAEAGAVRRPRPDGDARPVDGRRRHPQRARREAGPGRRRRSSTRRSAPASSTTSTASRVPSRPEAAPALFDRFGTPQQEPRVLPRAVGAHLLRPDHRAGADAPRHQRRVLPDPLVARPRTRLLRARRAVTLPPRGLRRRDARRSARSWPDVDRPDRRVPAPRSCDA